MDQSQRQSNQRLDDVATRRQRISKACDQCNVARAKCNGNQPCVRCVQSAEACSYTRPSRRHGRGSKLNNRPIRPEARPALQHEQQAESQAQQHEIIRVAPSFPSDRDTPLANVPMANGGHSLGPPLAATPFAWLEDGMAMAGTYEEPNWLNDVWAQQSLAFNTNQPATQVEPGQTPGPPPRAVRYGETPRSSTSQPEAVRYPVLAPLMPYLTRILSPALASDLLESYVSHTSDSYSPISPLLLAHIFRVDSLLSVSKPRKCSLALLSSMLLVSANTTEFPFFGASPTARSRLHQQLLQLTVALMDKGHSNLQKQRPVQRLQRSGSSIQTHAASNNSPPAQVWSSKTSPIDDVVTYMHIALVTTTTEAKPPGSHW